jgi:hypothetical protein
VSTFAPLKLLRRTLDGIILYSIGVSLFVLGLYHLVIPEIIESASLGYILVLISGLAIPTLVLPYYYWKSNYRYVLLSVEQLTESFLSAPLGVSSSFLLPELGARGQDAIGAYPLVEEAFRKSLLVSADHISTPVEIQWNAVIAAIRMGKQEAMSRVVAEMIETAPFQDEKRREHFVWSWIDYLRMFGPKAAGTMPLLTRLRDDPEAWLSKRVVKAAAKALQAIAKDE